MAHPDFGRSVNPISTRGDRLCQPNYLKLLGVEFDRNFATTPSLKKLATASNTRAAMIYRLGFSMPPHLLTTFANGLLMGKIMAFSPVNIPTRLNMDDHYHNYTGVTEDINKAIKAT